MTTKIDFLGIQIDSLTMDESVDKAMALIEDGGVHQHVVVNAAKVVAAIQDASLGKTISDCAMVNADGQSVVWASRMLGKGLPERVAGVDFMDRLLTAAAARSHSVYLLGASADVVSKVASLVRARGVTVAGFNDGFWRKHMSDDEMAASIRATNPDLVFVALPSPFKENFLRDNLDAMNARLCVGVGGTFDVMAGVTTRAPKWMQKMGLEWLHRLAQEPKRMFMRYLVGNSKFIYYVGRGYWRKIKENS
ncbi:N-acetylglucosaminyldiphosphoundecaprenol N-acetyl-beta-D-mannosaminyltransferase [Arthrobacter ginsengisoli]|uniref:N-acetylglucosaminyldiphosphoundecaprenol N-acetyl-beta-D-mannosaminyltransferase n=1 Tax=Arthrobacter ginsengisoli TaxID=1356565 RepID=A0ABU1UDH6_9MICC|nr:WecB/TagA/CpsF family glycosyltransferase [Arthrobacter ginsengisoli]MDR7083180.1 N-acetylglucosaminyldiphosphoundecaprenol N-acetyl-beta-D-mannosaminyltransferase [Arthrobacter ginsengisoli]